MNCSIAMANAALADRRGDTPENCRADLLRKIYWIQECYDNLERDYLDEIDAQVRRYTRAATQKIENLTNRDQNIRGNLQHGADRAVAQPACRRSGGQRFSRYSGCMSRPACPKSSLWYRKSSGQADKGRARARAGDRSGYGSRRKGGCTFALGVWPRRHRGVCAGLAR